MIFAVVLLIVCYFLIVFVAIRCADGRIGVNGMAGIRTPTIMTNEQTWLAAHKAAKTPTLIGAYAAMAATVLAAFLPAEPLQATAILVGCGLLLAGILVGAAKGTKAAKRVLEMR
ncbi:SdpI family protein [Arthrobacter sp. ERGS1:01]|uniref:SdpI family protein n=1 Tax=Arthrobacter sp. ERGS1:01 TaxID=1704044 RepID=UPI0006B48052|nr:SdpI family protein [Arthrobacter sp. ERGS1:01]